MDPHTDMTGALSGPCWERTALTALALLLGGLALTGVAGPLADPHFAERQMGHGHLYTGGEAVPHSHDAAGFAEGGDGVVYLPPSDDAAPGLSGFGAAVALATAGMALAALPLLRGSRARLATPIAARLRPPGPPPPRALLGALAPA